MYTIYRLYLCIYMYTIYIFYDLKWLPSKNVRSNYWDAKLINIEKISPCGSRVLMRRDGFRYFQGGDIWTITRSAPRSVVPPWQKIPFPSVNLFRKFGHFYVKIIKGWGWEGENVFLNSYISILVNQNQRILQGACCYII